MITAAQSRGLDTHHNTMLLRPRLVSVAMLSVSMVWRGNKTSTSWLLMSCLLQRITRARQLVFQTTTRRNSRLLSKQKAPPCFSNSYGPPSWFDRSACQRLYLSSSSSLQEETTSQQQDDDLLYEELKRTALEILRHDVLYYTPGQTPEVSDDVYDALVQKEEKICKEHPQLLEKWQQTSGMGIEATRFGGRVGMGSNGEDLLQSLQQEKDEDMESTREERLKRTHLTSMLSLDNVSSQPELLAWLERIRKLLSKQDNAPNRIQLLTEPKLDGLSLSLRYELDKTSSTYNLKWAATRGNGRQGQDVTAAIVEDMKLPSTLKYKDTIDHLPTELEIRGEIVLPKSVFDSFVTDHQDDDNSNVFANARNAASGILLRKNKDNQSTENQALRSKLVFYAYDLVSTKAEVVKDGANMRHLLQSFGFRVPEPIKITTLDLTHKEENNTTEWNMSDLQPVLEYYDALLEHREGKKNRNDKYNWGDYDMDGCVHKVVDLQLRHQLSTSNRAPRWAIAHKFPSTTAVTELLDIEVQVGRTGALTPVAILKPVTLAGVVVQRATLHNFGHAKHVLLDDDDDDKLPKNCSVVVRRAGDVIPQVVQRVEQENDENAKEYISLDPPETCPACGSVTVLDLRSSINDNSLGQVLRCHGPSLNCPPRAVGTLGHAYSRDALDITGLSQARIEQLMQAGLLKFPHDVFRLDVETLSKLDGWGTKSATNLVRMADQVKTRGVSLSRFIYSLGIHHVGAHTSKLIASTYGTTEAFLVAVDDAEYIYEGYRPFEQLIGTDDIEPVKGIGPVVIQALVDFSQDHDAVEAARDLAKTILIHKDDTPFRASNALPWYNMSVVFTGSMPIYTRSQAQALAKEMGAKSTPTKVSKSTSLVVAGVRGGKNLERARELGIKVMETSEFVRLVQTFQEYV